MQYQNKIKKFFGLFFVVLMFLSVGCQTSMWSSKNGTSVGPADATPTSVVAADAQTPKQPQPNAVKPQAATPQQIMADVRELGKVSPAAQAALMQELEKVGPDLWPSVVQNFRSRLAYGDRVYNEEKLAAKNALQQASKSTAIGPGQTPQYANQNPYYAGQPITGNVNPCCPTNGCPSPVQPSSYPYPNYPNQNPNRSSYQTPYPQQNMQPGTVPMNYPSTPMAVPNSSNQPQMPYPRTSSKPTDRGVILANYEEEEAEEEDADRSSLVKRVRKEEESEEEEDSDETAEATLTAPKPLDWEASLDASIEALQAKLKAAQKTNQDGDFESTATNKASQSDQLRLRFMLLAAGRGTEAVEPISGMSEAMTDFWAGQMFGLNDLLDERKASNPSLQKASAKRKLSNSLHHLGKVASLEVRNLSFCKAVNGFANIEQFSKYKFKAGDQIILYAELDNLKHEESVEGYRTSLEIGYEIFDSAERRVEPQQPNASEECSLVLRRDYYVSQLIRLPKRLYPGRYLLKIKVEDKLGKKYGESTAEFEVL